MPRFLLFLAWPLIEIGLFVVIGGQIGLWATLAWVVATAVSGIVILRMEASRGVGLLRSGLSDAAIRDGAPITGLMRALAAVLLILPGFLTDALGLLLFLPPVQTLLKDIVAARIGKMSAAAFAQARGGDPQHAPRPGGETVEGEWVEVPPEHPLSPGRNRPSRWTGIE